MNKHDKLIRSGVAAAVAVALGGLVYSNYAQTGRAQGGASHAQAGAGAAASANDPAAQRARRQWLASVTPPSGVAAADPRSIAKALRDKHMLILQAGLFDPNDPRQNLPNAGASVSERYAIVQFHGDARDQRATLENAGAKILGYVPNNAYLVRADRGIAGLRSLNGVRWAGGYRSDLKLAPELLKRAQSQADRGAGRSQLELSLFDPGVALQTAQTLADRIPGAKLLRAFDDQLSPILRIEVGNDTLAQALSVASRIDAVQHIADYVQPRDFNTATIAVLQSNHAPPGGGDEPGESNALHGATPLWAQGLIGGGQIIGVLDGFGGLLDQDEAWFAYYNAPGDEDEVARVTPTHNVAPAADGQELAPGPLHPNHKIVGFWKPASVVTIGNHATHVTGIVAGDLGGEFGTSLYAASSSFDAAHDRADGNAPNAQVLYQSAPLVNENPYDKILRQAHGVGVRVHNNSWGAAFAGYNANARAADIAMYQKDDLLVMIAAGNDGDSPALFGCPDGEFRGGRCWRSVGAPGTAKNSLSVAALGHGASTDVDSYSSRGTLDGRFKPDIAAPGTRIVSARNQNNAGVLTAGYAPTTAPLTGTSMATPAITASAALVRQYFSDGFYPSGQRTAADRTAPSAAALKAVMLNGTRPVNDPANASSAIANAANDWPIVGGGWGRPWLDSNLWFQRTTAGGNDERRLRLFERDNRGGLRTDDQHEYEIAAVREGQELRITLTWIDPPTTVGAAVALVNDLDLEVEGPDGRLYRGNQLVAGLSKEFCTRERYNRLRNTTRRCDQAGPANADALNNVEQVRLTAPVAGRYILRVKGGFVPGAGADLAGSDRQGYALVAAGAFGPPAGRAQLAAPGGVRVANRVALPAPSATVQFNAVANASGYQLYRVEGGCAAGNAAKRYRLVAHQSAAQGARPTLVDAAIDDNADYGYAVRAIGADVEGRLSACAASVSSANANVAAAAPAAVAAADAES
ncbi:S8 family serine peptidase [Lysobacter enzymogenes]|uniref:S8 family serine peptidase n=1 Tax=Lysobacter enzymogenes TaxID=69 RepID=UPI001A97517B|nr:S8 family serine peptidase [Lysobacter enzymogenes]QQP98663.1 S8 family serine peptidase [Lysobacter enzymogenes]